MRYFSGASLDGNVDDADAEEEDIDGGGFDAGEADTDADGRYSKEELSALTIAQIRAIAEDKGYTIAATRKADVIDEFLAAQG